MRGYEFRAHVVVVRAQMKNANPVEGLGHLQYIYAEAFTN